MCGELSGFAVLASSVDGPLDAQLFDLLWDNAEPVTLRNLARRAELPGHLHVLAARHPDPLVQLGYAENPAARSSLLLDIAGATNDANVLRALVQNPQTPEDALIGHIHTADRDLSLLALRRRGRTDELAVAAATRLAGTGDATGANAAAQLAGLLGSDPSVHVATLRAATADALGYVHAALHACGVDPEVRTAFISWVDRYHNHHVGSDYKELQKLISDFATSPVASVEEREWSLSRLHAAQDRVGPEASLALQTGKLDELVRNETTVRVALEYVEFLSGRHPGEELAGYVAVAISTLRNSNGDILGTAARQLRRVFNPVVDQALRILAVDGDLELQRLLVNLAGPGHLDALADPWDIIDGLTIDLRRIADLRVVRSNPRQALERLRPLEVLLRCGDEYKQSAIRALDELEVGSPTWATAAVLATTWQGTLDELITAARAL